LEGSGPPPTEGIVGRRGNEPGIGRASTNTIVAIAAESTLRDAR